MATHIHVDSMGVGRPTFYADRFPPPPNGAGSAPRAVEHSQNRAFFAGAQRPYTPVTEAIVGHPTAGLPFDPTTPVPGDGRGWTQVTWPTPGTKIERPDLNALKS